MATLAQRVDRLERSESENLGPLLVWVDDPPTDEQRRRIEEAERIGRPVIPIDWCDASL